jgi:hypothetical protein
MSQLTEHIQNPSANLAEAQSIYTPESAVWKKPGRIFSRLVALLLSPREGFLEIAKKPEWLVPLILATGIVLAGNLFFKWYVNPDVELIVRERVQQRDTANNRLTSEEDIERQIAFTRKISTFMPVVGGVATTAAYLLLAAIFCLGLRGIGLTAGFRPTLSVVSWSAALTNIFAAIGFIGATLVVGPERLSTYDQSRASNLLATNLGAFLSTDSSPVIKSLAASLDLLTIWRLILLSVGFSTVLSIRRGDKAKVWSLVLGLWAAWIIVKALAAYVMNG